MKYTYRTPPKAVESPADRRPRFTCDIMQDQPLRSEEEHTIGSE